MEWYLWQCEEWSECEKCLRNIMERLTESCNTSDTMWIHHHLAYLQLCPSQGETLSAAPRSHRTLKSNTLLIMSPFMYGSKPFPMNPQVIPQNGIGWPWIVLSLITIILFARCSAASNMLHITCGLITKATRNGESSVRGRFNLVFWAFCYWSLTNQMVPPIHPSSLYFESSHSGPPFIMFLSTSWGEGMGLCPLHKRSSYQQYQNSQPCPSLFPEPLHQWMDCCYIHPKHNDSFITGTEASSRETLPDLTL